MTPLRLTFLALAVWGAVHPMYWFVKHMRETGTGLSGLIDAWYVNASTTGLTWDLTIAAVAARSDGDATALDAHGHVATATVTNAAVILVAIEVVTGVATAGKAGLALETHDGAAAAHEAKQQQ